VDLAEEAIAGGVDAVEREHGAKIDGKTGRWEATILILELSNPLILTLVENP
jgi:hypothetical protein